MGPRRIAQLPRYILRCLVPEDWCTNGGMSVGHFSLMPASGEEKGNISQRMWPQISNEVVNKA